jgi:hypothetical protein
MVHRTSRWKTIPGASRATFILPPFFYRVKTIRPVVVLSVVLIRVR